MRSPASDDLHFLDGPVRRGVPGGVAPYCPLCRSMTSVRERVVAPASTGGQLRRQPVQPLSRCVDDSAACRAVARGPATPPPARGRHKRQQCRRAAPRIGPWRGTVRPPIAHRFDPSPGTRIPRECTEAAQPRQRYSTAFPQPSRIEMHSVLTGVATGIHSPCTDFPWTRRHGRGDESAERPAPVGWRGQGGGKV